MPLPQPFIDAQTAMAASAAASGSDRKAVVVIYLGGGADPHNTLTPRTGANRTAYTSGRSTAALADNSATALNADLQFHPSLTALKTIWDAGDLAVVQNIAPLVFPTTKAQFEANSVELPPQLLSHSDQNANWQTAIAESPTADSGWFGRMADLVKTAFNPSSTIPPSITFAGLQTAHRAYDATTLGSGATGLDARNGGNGRIADSIQTRINTINNATYGNAQQEAYADSHRRAIAATTTITNAINSVTLATSFPSSGIATQLRTAVRLIGSQSSYSQRRTTLWVTHGGYDHHADLVTALTARYNELSPALAAYYTALGEIGRLNDVVTLIYTEFGRSLTQNGSGTDHGWGGHAYVFGGGVTGGFYGTYPDLSLSGPNMVTPRGYLVPTLPYESLYSTIAQWFGVPDALADGVNPIDLMLPNMERFPTRDLGFV